MTTLVSNIWGAISDNIVGVLIVVGAIVGISFVMALIDTAKEGRIDNSHRGFRGRYLP